MTEITEITETKTEAEDIWNGWMNWWIFRYAENMLDSCVQRIWATIQCPDDSHWQAEYAGVNSEACFFDIFISELNNAVQQQESFKGTKLGGVAGKTHGKVSILSDLKKQRTGSTETSWGSRMMESQKIYFWRDLLKLSSPAPQSDWVCFWRVFLLQAEQYQISGSYERCSSSLPQRLYGALTSVSPCLSHTQQFRTKHGTPDAASPVLSRKGLPLLQLWENATNAVQDTFWPSFLWERTSAVHQNAKVLCRAEKCFLDAWHLDNPGVRSYSTQEKNIALPSAELHKAPSSPFLQPVKVPLNGNTTIHQLFLTALYYLWELAEGLLCLSILVCN